MQRTVFKRIPQTLAEAVSPHGQICAARPGDEIDRWVVGLKMLNGRAFWTVLNQYLRNLLSSVLEH